MKKLMMFALAALMLLGLAACGGTNTQETVDLTAYYDSMAEQLDWGENFLVDMPDDMLDTYYPGLKDMETKQLIAKMPMMSAVVNEIVLLECASPEDAEKAAELLQQRAEEQADGGAWYPESMEAWGNAYVATNGNYAALIVSGQDQQALVDAYNALFSK